MMVQKNYFVWSNRIEIIDKYHDYYKKRHVKNEHEDILNKTKNSKCEIKN